MQRSSVDLPEPDAPIRQITSCSATARSIPFSTSSSSKRLCRPSMRTASAVTAPPPVCRRLRSRATIPSTNRVIGTVITR